MYKALSPSAVGLKPASIPDAIELARASGFTGLELNMVDAADWIEQNSAEALKELFHDADLIPAGWPLAIDWRSAEDIWKQALEQLPRAAQAARALGCTRCFTWVMPCSDELSMPENIAFHTQRLSPIAKILAEYGCRLGLEFIGPKTLRESRKYPFISTMEEMLDLAAMIGPNVGILLDSFHWHTSGGTTDDIRDLCTTENVVYVHVNDAPSLPLDEQMDQDRALPGATGVIDLRGFLMTLDQVGYDGPIVAEPFGNPATWTRQALDAVYKLSDLA